MRREAAAPISQKLTPLRPRCPGCSSCWLGRSARAHWPSQWCSASARLVLGRSRGVVGTNYATTFVGLYAKVQHAQQSGSLRAYVDSYRWRKCATSSCTGTHAQTTITTQETDPMDRATLVSFLRIPTVYVDKPQFSGSTRARRACVRRVLPHCFTPVTSLPPSMGVCVYFLCIKISTRGHLASNTNPRV